MASMAKFSFRLLNPKNFKKLTKKQKIIYISSVIAIILIIGLIASVLFGKDAPEVTEEEPQKYYSQLTGLEVSEEDSKQPILGIMVENHPDARPQTGLDSAGIVFETIAEGGITRYLALFQENQPEEIGPVRSVRVYYLDWAMGFDASLAHVGGAADALNLIDQRNAKSLSQFQYTEPYHRTDDRVAPHNMYATTSLLRSLQKDLNHKTAEFDPIPRSDDSPITEEEKDDEAKVIKIDFSIPTYGVEFRYRPETNDYVRHLDGSPDIDAATNKPIVVKNVVVIWMKTDTISATGLGNGILFKDGKSQNIKWAMPSYRERIKFSDKEGNEIELNKGDLWISALPQSKDVEY